MTNEIARRVYEDNEAAFLWDYVEFGAEFRRFTAHHLKQAGQVNNAMAQRHALLGVFREMMASFEDFSALLLGLRRRYSSDPKCKFQQAYASINTPVLFTLINYRDMGIGKVVGTMTAAKCYDAFHFDRLVPHGLDQPGFLSSEAVEKGLRRLADFVVADCLKHEQEGIRPQAYNKIKHGAVVLSDGKLLIPTLPLGPAILDATVTDAKTANPITVYTIPVSGTHLDLFDKMVWAVGIARRIILALYLWREHELFVRSRGVQHPGVLFDQDMRALLEYRDLGQLK
jgi:hypothetical protein